MTDYTSAFAELGAATIGESGGHPMDPRVHAVWKGARVSGPAYPVACSATDNLGIHAAVADAPAGSVLVVSVDVGPPRGYWGEVLTTGAIARGIAGLVIDGGVRDLDALEAHQFPVFATMVALKGATKERHARIGRAALVGDTDVERDDWIVGDADGVVVIPHDRLDAVLEAGRARAAKEQQLFAELKAGKTTMELLNLSDEHVDRGNTAPPDMHGLV
jgi:4-hydroxy-4-methyl-2-oxoglutarate aldolase